MNLELECPLLGRLCREKTRKMRSSHFFTMHKDMTGLDGRYTAFGRVVSDGVEAVDAICEAAEPIAGNDIIPAEVQSVIESITVVE